MHEVLIAKLTAKDDKYACAIADKIIFESQDIVTQYNQDLTEWEQIVKEGQKSAEKQHRPPERQSVRNRLRRLQADRTLSRSRERNPKTETDNHDIEIDTAGQPALRSYIYMSIRKHPARFLRLAGCQYIQYVIFHNY